MQQKKVTNGTTLLHLYAAWAFVFVLLRQWILCVRLVVPYDLEIMMLDGVFQMRS